MVAAATAAFFVRPGLDGHALVAPPQAREDAERIESPVGWQVERVLIADDVASLPTRHRVLSTDGAVVNVDESLAAGAADMGKQSPPVAGRGLHLPIVGQMNVLSRFRRVRGHVNADVLDLAIQIACATNCGVGSDVSRFFLMNSSSSLVGFSSACSTQPKARPDSAATQSQRSERSRTARGVPETRDINALPFLASRNPISSDPSWRAPFYWRRNGFANLGPDACSSSRLRPQPRRPC